MTFDQMVLFALLGAVFGLLIWGRWRYDLVAFGALVAALLIGVVPHQQAFSGFGHEATVIIVLVLVVSRGLSNSGAIDLVGQFVSNAGTSVSVHIARMATVGAAMSAVMNNVAALALLMPIDVQAAAKAKRSPARTLMPLSFATILGGLITLIGTPPNIIIASYRGQLPDPQQIGATLPPFGMFDFAPVGIVAAIVGVAFVALIGWRLIPRPSGETSVAGDLFKLDDYIAEIRVPESCELIGKTVRDLDETAEEYDVLIVGLIRGGKRLAAQARRQVIQEGDVLVLEAGASAIDKFVGKMKLQYSGESQMKSGLTGSDLGLLEVVVPSGAEIEGRSALQMRLLFHYSVTLLGVSRQGRPFRESVRRLRIEAGDVLLLLGPTERLLQIAELIGALPLASRGLKVANRRMGATAVALFVGAIALASLGLVPLPIALALTCVLMVVTNIVPLRELYDSIEWPVIVLLGSLLPIGFALEQSGGTALIAKGLVDISLGAPNRVVLTILMVVTMTLSDLLNNTATAVISAPIAVDVANALGVSPDPFLMAVAVAASCAFLTPIGHKNNTLILGPGGYRFGDYWQMGLPLEIIVIAVSVPMILLVWPF